MAYDAGLAERVRDALGDLPGLTDKRMFGTLAFLAGGNLLVCVRGDDLMVRVGRDAVPDALRHPGAGEMNMTGRPMRDWVLVDGAVLDDDVLTDWIGRAWEHVRTL